mmetsp:Transcript_20118/g.37396  ORF Transcript_20118/g.37396 Transcript_20118/m.37396 type:complete len:418 (+) Transcript_20118:307-1560(+)
MGLTRYAVLAVLAGVVVSTSTERVDEERELSSGKPVWPLPAGEGVDLETLDKCLEKNLRYYQLEEPLKSLDEEFPGIPLIRKNTLFSGESMASPYGTGSFGSSTTWTISKSKKLCYMLIQKVGSMSFREMTARCDPSKNIPCDVLNRHGRPWRSIDAGPNYKAGGGFYANKFKGKHVPGSLHDITFAHDFEKQIEDCFKFTFVSDPIAHLTRGYRQLHHAHSQVYATEFEKFAQYMGDPERDTLNVNIHIASPIIHLYRAAQEATVFANKHGENVKYQRPFDFIGRLERGYADEDWKKVVKLHDGHYPSRANMLDLEVASENEGSGDPVSSEERKAMRDRAKKEHLSTLMRQYSWGVAHAKSAKMLGDYAHLDTMPKDLTRKLCAAYYADFVCLGRAFPSQCTDSEGNYNVKEWPLP